MPRKKKQIYKYPLVEILWDDAEVTNHWEDNSETVVNEVLCTTVGFLVKETDTHLVIASTYAEDLTNARIQIPKGMVKTRKAL